MSIKNPLIPAGIEPATFRFVAQHLNHCATAVPFSRERYSKNVQIPNHMKFHPVGAELFHADGQTDGLT